MKLLKKVIRLPKPLWRLHGTAPLLIDLIFTYAFAIVVSINNLSIYKSGSTWAALAMIIISFDIAGGVISNFSQSTIAYYNQHSKSPIPFIWTHILHAFILIWIFPDHKIETAPLTVFILLCAHLVSITRDRNLQRMLSISLFCFVLVVVVTLMDLPAPLSILLLLLSFKLIIGFAGKWN